MHLDAIQNAYSKAIYSADTEALESLIHGREGFTTRTRVDIYRNNTHGSLQNTLSQVFPVCEALVGENYFKQLAAAYVSDHPSLDRNLDEYGAEFPQSLTDLIEIREELHALSYLDDVAQLEWLIHQSYYSDNRSTFDIEQFSQLSAEQQTQVRFKLAVDISLMQSPYPVYDIWLKHQPESSSISDEENDRISFNDAEHSYLLIQRQQWKTNTQIIDKGLFRLLQAIDHKTALIDLTGFLEDSPTDIAELIQQRMVIGFEDGSAYSSDYKTDYRTEHGSENGEGDVI